MLVEAQSLATPKQGTMSKNAVMLVLGSSSISGCLLVPLVLKHLTDNKLIMQANG